MHGLDLAKTVGGAFAEATHTAFLVNGAVLIAAAVITAAFLHPRPPATTDTSPTSIAPIKEPTP